jgi:cell division protein FtsB
MPLPKTNNKSVQLLIISGLLIVASMFYKYASAVYKDYQVETEINRLQFEIERLTENNKDLEKLIDYLDTDAYKEMVAKEELNLRRPGEIVIAIKEGQNTTREDNLQEFTPDSEYTSIPIYQKWIKIFIDL